MLDRVGAERRNSCYQLESDNEYLRLRGDMVELEAKGERVAARWRDLWADPEMRRLKREKLTLKAHSQSPRSHAEWLRVPTQIH